jgi:threonine/homoserine/homoserine lactone efflux protein
VIDPLFLFAAMALATVATPGPTTLLILHQSGQWGLRAAWLSICGAVLSDAVLISAVVAGLGVVLTTSAQAFELLRWIGVIYLTWLGWQWLRGSKAFEIDTTQMKAPSASAAMSIGLRSFAVAITNPKGYLFFAAILPPFIDPNVPSIPQYLTLAVVFMAIDALVLWVYALAGSRGFSRLKVSTRQRIQQASGGAMLFMALALALWKR